MYGEDVGDFVFVELRQVLAVTIVSHVELGEDLYRYMGEVVVICESQY